MGKSNTYEKSVARQDFDKAKNKAFFNKVLNNIFKKNNSLFQFDEVKYLLAPHGMTYRGMKTISIDKIIGSEGRYTDFDKDFLPRQTHTRYRWENIDIARMKDVDLPPISVYKIGDYYFVKDGNHRVSVAREKGQDYIDAEVVELFTRVKISEKHLDQKGLLVAEGQKYFLEKSHLDVLLPGVEIELTNPWGYYRLLEHINTFKYLLAEKDRKEITWEDSVKKWYNGLYFPVIEIIREKNMLKNFSDRTEGDLYIWVMDHWHFLKEKYGDVELKSAISDYSRKYGQKPFRRFFISIKKFIASIFTGK